MMGAHHAACGAAAWLALTSKATLPFQGMSIPLGLGLMDLPPTGVMLGALVCAGSAMLPDADHPKATIAHALPPLTTVITTGIGRVAGGHRHGTHSILGVLFFLILAWGATWLTPRPVALMFGVTDSWWIDLPLGSGILILILTGFALTTLKIVPQSARRAGWAIAIAATFIVVVFTPGLTNWLPMVVAIGVIAHIAGDFLTTGGINPVWPLTVRPPKPIAKLPLVSWCWKPNGYLAFPILGNTGSGREWVFLVPISIYVLVGFGAEFFIGMKTMAGT